VLIKNESIKLRGFNLVDRVAIRSKLTTGGSSITCSHPTGGDAGGDMRNVF